MKKTRSSLASSKLTMSRKMKSFWTCWREIVNQSSVKSSTSLTDLTKSTQLSRRSNSNKVRAGACMETIATIRIWRTFLARSSKSLASRMMLTLKALKSGSKLPSKTPNNLRNSRKDRHPRRMRCKTTLTPTWRITISEEYRAQCRPQIRNSNEDLALEMKKRLSRCLRWES